MSAKPMSRAAAVLIGFCALSPATFAQQAEGDKDEEKDLFIIEPKYFQPTATNSQGGIGFSYKVDHNLSRLYSDGDFKKFSTLNLDFTAEGNVAFNSDINPSDFLKTGLDFNWLYAWAEAPKLNCDMTKVRGPELEECLRQARRAPDGAALRIYLGAIGGLESDQKFDKRQWTYGTHATTRYRPARNSLANVLNPFDWPFLLSRRVTGHPERGAIPDAFPTVRFALERVKPQKDQDREAILGQKDHYNRANVEIAMSTPAAVLKGKQIKFEWSWRYFKELSPDARIEEASLDRFQYAAASLRLDSGWRVTHARGRLPLDRQSDKVWEIGYKVDLK